MDNKKNLLIILSLVLLATGCASTQQQATADHEEKQYQHPADPYEGFNRTVYGFNHAVDHYFLKPVTQGYRYVTPDIVETGVSNFFSNLLEIRNAVNALLQGKGAKAANYTGRFLFNSTFGVGGLIDVASKAGIEKTNGEDFGQTLGTWGVKSGPYLMLPLLGPSNIRDGLSIPADMYLDPVTYVDEQPLSSGLTLLEIIDTRAKFLGQEKLLSGDRYVFIRDAYLQRREYLIQDGVVEDTFGNDDIDEDF